MDRDTALKLLGGLRLAVGVGAWATPNVSGKLFGLDTEGNPQAPYLARLFGIRDVALGVGPLRAKKKAQENWIELGIMCDSADFVAALLAGGKGYLSPSSAAMVAAPALAATALGVVALRS